ncbi:hypothetical protein H5410_047455, partial [Solanum commersonii]
MEENTDNVSLQERTFDRNLRRRARYAQMSPERKELFLSQLREKKAESKRQKVLHQSNSTAALTINTSSLSPQQGQLTIFLSSFCEMSFLNIYSYRECIVNCLSTFEVGSTSTASHVATKLSSRYTANRDMLLSTKVIKKHVLSCDYTTDNCFLPCTCRNKKFQIANFVQQKGFNMNHQ